MGTLCYCLCKEWKKTYMYISVFAWLFTRNRDVTKKLVAEPACGGRTVAGGQEGGRLFITYPLVPFEF